MKILCLINFLIVLALSLPVQAAGAKRYPYQSCFEVASSMHKVPLDLLLAVAATESNWDADARSKANAHGIMQIQWPGTARHLGVKRVGELYNPCLNIALGAKYLNELLVSFKPSEERALAAYNYGPTRIKAAKQLPQGAQAYAAKVVEHRHRIAGGLIPRALQPQTRQALVTFASKTRAESLARRIRSDIEGATIAVERRKRPTRGYAVVLEVGKAGLTVRDHVMLTNMGWPL